MNLTPIKIVVDDIKSIKIQGATNIAKAGINVLSKEIKTQTFKNIKEFDTFLKQAIVLLKNARATEPMLFNGLKACLAEYKKLSEKKEQLKTIQLALSKVAKVYVQDIETEEELRPIIGAKIIKKNMNIMTHCHSGSVVKLLTTAHKQNKKIHVYNTETRPLYQGRKTSQDLVKAGVPDTMITDNAAPFFVDNLYESDVYIDMVIIGSDAIKIDGSVYNKVGSFSIALAAWHSKIPVYIVGSLTKVDTENTVKIEQRSGQELRSNAPKGLEILNYAFDMVPAKFITGIITEYGIIKPKDIKKTVKKYYPWMIK
ncbi:MAG TPA: translation initiation factor eIF-2B [Candidatus Absconditabacterales bacterium]|nr:translation initiation factor eIF-2B [Candidatus Absconditabacterales bacterium]